MKRPALFLLAILTAFTVMAQDITGQWNGALKVQGMQLRLVLNVTKSDKGYTATMDSPDQGAKGIPVTTTTFDNPVFKFEVANLNIKYTGELKGNTIAGTFKQGELTLPMDLSREKIEAKPVVRPQEPTKPYPYYSEEITFDNEKDKITLAGTLTLPQKEGSFPAVVLISGSGPQNRDEELMGHKPFLVLSDYLTRNGIAVLRYDDRGTAQSKGDFKTATTQDLAADAEAAVRYLQTRKEINKNQIGLIGHSEGGIIAPMVAARSKDISFIVLLAGTGIPGDQLLLMQQEQIAKARGASEEMLQKTKVVNKGAFDIVVKTSDPETLKTELTNYLRQQLKELPAGVKPAAMSEDDFIKLQVSQLSSPWMQYFIKYDPAPALTKVTCPVLALNGEKDLQVPSKVNLEAIEKSLQKGGNKKVTIKELPGLNHLFQECQTGAPEEYATIEQTISPTALSEIANWISKQTK